MHRRRRVAGCSIAGLAALALTLGIAAPVMATTEPVDDVMEELVKAAPEIADSVAAESDTSSELDGVTAEVTETTISIASDVGTFGLTAPSAEEGSSIESVLLDEGSALFAILIETSDAPSSYAFDIDLPADAVVVEAEDGSVFFETAVGEFLGGVAAPWAKDASGKEISTWFSIDGEVLTQHVDLSDTEGISFPVIADPLAGKWLVSGAWVTYQSSPNTYVVNATPTAFGRTVTSSDHLGTHTADLKARLGNQAYRVTSSIENQFHCHVVYNAGGGGDTYNMESWRPDIWWWVQAAQGCNP